MIENMHGGLRQFLWRFVREGRNKGQLIENTKLDGRCIAVFTLASADIRWRFVTFELCRFDVVQLNVFGHDNGGV